MNLTIPGLARGRSVKLPLAVSRNARAGAAAASAPGFADNSLSMIGVRSVMWLTVWEAKRDKKRGKMTFREGNRPHAEDEA
jgi:hypothetical protein